MMCKRARARAFFPIYVSGRILPIGEFFSKSKRDGKTQVCHDASAARYIYIGHISLLCANVHRGFRPTYLYVCIFVKEN